MSDQQPQNQQELIIYSNLAKRLIDGRKGDKTLNQYPIYGLLQFAGKVNVIWQSVKQDNLYSRWFLIRADWPPANRKFLNSHLVGKPRRDFFL